MGALTVSMQPAPNVLLAAVVAIGFLLRVVLFTGLSLGDDVFYQLQAIAHGRGGAWPPLPFHWETRLGITLPTAALLKLFGLHPWVFVAVPLAASTAGIWVAYRIAREFVDERVALFAALCQACYPLELIFSTHLYPDVPVALFQSLSLWFWLRALRSERTSDYVWAGLYFGLGYLCRETVVMSGPGYLAIWALRGRWRRPRIAWSAVAALAIVGGEIVLYWLTTGNPLYRVDAITARQQQAPLGVLHEQTVAEISFWTEPLAMLVANQEFGAYQAAVLPAFVYAWKRFPQLRALIVWWLALFVWSFYGTTLPTAYVPMWRDPRYASTLTVPAVIILAQVLAALPVTMRRLGGAGLVASGVVAATLDQGSALIGPHRQFAASEYVPQTVMEPFEYYGARWTSGLEQPVEFRCATDLGREAVLALLSHLRESRCASFAGSRYVVFSAERRPDLADEFDILGWREVTRFSGSASFGRRAVASLLARLPGQEERVRRIAAPPTLRVLENPVQFN